jgi:RNase adaptor protein for sRNA GlmZ degradation
MDDKWKIWLSVAIAAIIIAILLRLMMVEFNNNGLSVLAVSLGFCTVGTLQCVSVYITEKCRELPQQKTDRFWKL